MTVAERSFSKRILDGLRSAFSIERLESKTDVIYVPQAYSPGMAPYGVFAGSQKNYAVEAGELIQSSLVMAVVNFTATTLPEAPLRVMRPEGDGASPDPKHTLTKLWKRPNTYNSGQTMLSGMATSWWVDGNVYLRAVMNEAKTKIVELWYIPHFLIEPRWPGDGLTPTVPKGKRLTPDGWVQDEGDVYISYYEYRIDNQRFEIPPEHIIHLRRHVNVYNTRKGVGAFDSVLREIYGDNAATNFSAALLRNYGVISHLITPKDGNTVDREDALAFKEQFVRSTTGDRAGGVVVNTIPLDVVKLGFNPQELDLASSHHIPESRVAAVTGIPAAVLQFMIGLENGTSYASYEQAKLQAYESVIQPMQGVWASEIDAQLLTLFDGPDTENFVEFDTSGVRVLQEDRNKLINRAVTAFRGGLITRGRGKTWIGEPSDDKVDDVYFGEQRQAPELPAKTLKQITSGNGHHRKVTQPIASKGKSVEWEGLTLSREPNDAEKIAVKGIAEAQEEGRALLKAVLLDIRASLVKAAVTSLVKLSPSEYHTLVLNPPKKAGERVLAELESVRATGREQVATELGSTKAWKADDEDEFDLDDLADLTLSTVLNDVQSRASSIALRLAFFIFYGIDPGEQDVCHRCDNPPCCNPFHLFMGTRAVNLADMRAKSRQAKGERHGIAKLTDSQVAEIKRRYVPRRVSMCRLAAEFGVSQMTINNIIHGKIWKHVKPQ